MTAERGTYLQAAIAVLLCLLVTALLAPSARGVSAPVPATAGGAPGRHGGRDNAARAMDTGPPFRALASGTGGARRLPMAAAGFSGSRPEFSPSGSAPIVPLPSAGETPE